MIRRAAVFVVLLAFAVSPSRAQQPETTTTGSELLNRVTDAYPSYSPDGDWIAYMSNADGDFDIYVMSPSLGERRKLTDAPGQDGQPVWSPDGRRIAFRSMRDGHSQIYIMDSDGSGQRNISNSAYHDEHPFWSADGERILFASNRSTSPDEENMDIYEMRTDGTDVRRITRTPEVETYPSWSPDGTRIAARRVLDNGNWEVVVMDSEGASARTIAAHPSFDGWPVWSPDSRRLAFASERAGSSDIWLVDLETGELRRLTWDEDADERQPWFSPDGHHMVFSRYIWFPEQPFYEAAQIRLVRVE